MIDYQKGKIYKIVCDEEPELVYYGSTCEILSNRMSAHRASYKRNQAGLFNNITSFQIIKYPTSQIVLVENYPCQNKEELNARERWWIENNQCVNKNRPGIFLEKGLKEYHIQYGKEYYKKYAAKAKEYYVKNKEKITNHAKEHIKCECGAEYARAGKTQHRKTAKHANLMEVKALTDEINAMMLIDAPDMIVETVLVPNAAT